MGKDYKTWNTIRQTLGRSGCGVLQDHILNAAAEQLCEALGIDASPGRARAGEQRIGPDAPLKNAVAGLVAYVPEDGYPKKLGERIPDDCPLFTEAALYPLFGKEAARTLLGRLHKVAERAGVPR